MVTGDKAPDYDMLIKRDRLRMDNLLKKKKKRVSHKQPDGSERITQPSQTEF